MSKHEIELFFVTQYAAAVADDALCRAFLDNDQNLIVGFLFSDPSQNYHFLSECDLEAFTDEQVDHMHRRQQSPFAEMLLIFYRDDEGVSCKLVNGMGSKLLLEAQRFCGN